MDISIMYPPPSFGFTSTEYEGEKKKLQKSAMEKVDALTKADYWPPLVDGNQGFLSPTLFERVISPTKGTYSADYGPGVIRWDNQIGRAHV